VSQPEVSTRSRELQLQSATLEENLGKPATRLLMTSLGSHRDPDDIPSLWNIEHLPGLPTLSRARVDLGIDVGLSHPAEQVGESRRLRGSGFDNERTPEQAQVNWRVSPEVDFLREALRDSHGEVVTPTLESRLHRVLLRLVSTM